MKYTLSPTPTLPKNSQLILGVFSDDLSQDKPLDQWRTLFSQTNQVIFQRLLSRLNTEGDCVSQADIEDCSLLLVHCGEKAHFNANAFIARLKDITAWLLKQSGTSATIALPAVNNQSSEWQLNSSIQYLESSTYQLLDFKQSTKTYKIANIHFVHPNLTMHDLKQPTAIASGMNLTRTLANLPANICTPQYLADQAKHLAEQYASIQTTILDRDDIHELGMNAFLAVNQGSHQPPCFIEIHYKSKEKTHKAKPIVLIGKGVTFDSGGISIKPAENMNEMKYDMGGAASVFGTIKACAELQLPLHVIGLIPATENMPGGSAVKPGDIVTSMSGQTIEITNTDAEGRLLLADTLTYAKRFKPHCVLDMATLTGAMIVALGHHITGYMTQDDALATLIKQAAESSHDKAWRLPLDDDYQEALDSPLADMINAPFNRAAGSITAACFLARFAKGLRWAHLDIAGTAWVSGKQNHATGRPVSLLVHLLQHIAEDRDHQ